MASFLIKEEFIKIKRWKGIGFIISNIFPPLSSMKAFFVYHFLFCFSLLQDKWRGIPTRLNNIPHSREIRKYFYDDVIQATQRAVNDGKTRLKVLHYYQKYMHSITILMLPIIWVSLTMQVLIQNVKEIRMFYFKMQNKFKNQGSFCI